MSLIIADKKITNICVIDDDANSRYGWGLTVEDLKLNPIPQHDKVNDINAYLNDVSKKCDAIITDHHLRKKNYFPVNGAEIVYKCYDYKIPSILVTRYEQAVIDEIRQYRTKIPVILSPEDFDTESLVNSIEICVNEFNGNMTQERIPWRTLIRIDDLDEFHVYLLVPGWNPNEMVSISRSIIPKELNQQLKPDMRLFASVNTGAQNSRDLYFSNWEIK